MPRRWRSSCGPSCSRCFPPALLGRIVTIPTYPLSDEMLGGIVRLQLDRIGKRIARTTTPSFVYDDAVVDHIVSLCNDPDSGGRMIDNIITNTLLPALSREFLKRSLAKEELKRGAGDDRERRLRLCVGLTARRMAAMSETINQKVVNWARAQSGKQVGKGECWDLADRALRQAGAQSSADLGPMDDDADYVWGDEISDLKDVQPGDILQFRDFAVTTTVETETRYADGSWRPRRRRRRSRGRTTPLSSAK